MLQLLYSPADVYLAAGLHESDCALAAKLGLEYKISDKVKEDPNEFPEYEPIAVLQLGMKIRIKANAQLLYVIDVKVGYNYPQVTSDTNVQEMAE